MFSLVKHRAASVALPPGVTRRSSFMTWMGSKQLRPNTMWSWGNKHVNFNFTNKYWEQQLKSSNLNNSQSIPNQIQDNCFIEVIANGCCIGPTGWNDHQHPWSLMFPISVKNLHNQNLAMPFIGDFTYINKYIYIQFPDIDPSKSPNHHCFFSFPFGDHLPV
jgi:carbohydrate-binding DOMON domain-containing protein